ncbi:methionine-R-sulfoxide reductase B3 isoform X6 [Micropterus salmoides]|uniref:methionine-R-sulfoxide reductase B3 isoform X6 n=1 Tax=Micropterus salmoides TaxID=27706 RepID=UPI0018EAC117|nr:methionine-R-sulfoxide reductase B3 isoform X6 [Micropterus salmoides]
MHTVTFYCVSLASSEKAIFCQSGRVMRLLSDGRRNLSGVLPIIGDVRVSCHSTRTRTHTRARAHTHTACWSTGRVVLAFQAVSVPGLLYVPTCYRKIIASDKTPRRRVSAAALLRVTVCLMAVLFRRALFVARHRALGQGSSSVCHPALPAALLAQSLVVALLRGVWFLWRVEYFSLQQPCRASICCI